MSRGTARCLAGPAARINAGQDVGSQALPSGGPIQPADGVVAPAALLRGMHSATTPTWDERWGREAQDRDAARRSASATGHLGRDVATDGPSLAALHAMKKILLFVAVTVALSASPVFAAAQYRCVGKDGKEISMSGVRGHLKQACHAQHGKWVKKHTEAPKQ